MKIKYILYSIVFYTIGCKGTGEIKNPPGYDLTKPEQFVLPGVLTEISGIAFNSHNSDSIYAIQDEDGKFFHLKWGDKNIEAAKFGKKGDYEDLAICNNNVIVLRSDGTLFSFLLNDEPANVNEWKNNIPEGEYEGLYADAATNLLYVLCKHCADDKAVTGYMLQLKNDSIIPAGNFSIDIKSIAAAANEKKIKFHASAITKHPLTKEWYILSSVNKLLLVTDSNWIVKATYPLPPSRFNQPEGIAFDDNGNLYISNEGGETNEGNILKFILKK